MSKKVKSNSRALADEIAALSNPRPKDYDPEDDVMTSFGMTSSKRGKHDDDDENADEYEAIDQRSSSKAKSAPSKPSMRSGVPVLSGKAYAGKISSRSELDAGMSLPSTKATKRSRQDAKLSHDSEEEEEEEEEIEFDDSEEEEDFDGEEDDGEEDEFDQEHSSDEESFEGESDISFEIDTEGLEEMMNMDGGDEEDKDDESEDQDEEEEDDEGDAEDDDEEEKVTKPKSQPKKRGSTAAHEEDMARQLRELQEEEKAAMDSLVKANQEEYQKALHVKNQKLLSNQLLGLRIRMQKALDVANRMPQPDSFPSFKKDERVSAAYEQAAHSVADLLSDLLSIRSELLKQNEPVQQAIQATSSSSASLTAVLSADKIVKDVAGAWKSMEQSFTQSEMWRDETIDRWAARVRLQAGATLMQKKFKSINQSITQQIKMVMTDEERVLKRAHLKRSTYRIIGKRQKTSAPSTAEETAPAIPSTFDQYDDEIFDDSDFYASLLKDLIETGVSELDPSSGQAVKLFDGKKKKKEIKDKHKVNYDVHAKIVNFMVAVPRPLPAVADTLFARLFGQSPEENRTIPDDQEEDEEENQIHLLGPSDE